jgi:hypothetical protein
MLDRLPTELLLDILELASEGPIGRRSQCLYRICLVSEALQKVAQPLLWQKVLWREERYLKSILRGKGDTSRGLVARELAVPENSSMSKVMHMGLLQALPHLVKLPPMPVGLRKEEAVALSELTSA